MTLGRIYRKSLEDSLSGLKGCVAYLGFLLIAINWPLVFVWIEPSGNILIVGFMVTIFMCVTALRFGTWLYGADTERFVVVAVTVAVISTVAFAFYAKLGESVRALYETERTSTAVPRWSATGMAQAQVLSAIPSAANAVSICATPIFAPNAAGRSEAVSWLVQKRERRLLPVNWSHRGDRCDRKLLAEFPTIIPLPERSHTPLVFEAIRDSVSRFGIAAGPDRQIYLLIDYSKRELILHSLGFAGVIFLLNTLLFLFLIRVFKKASFFKNVTVQDSFRGL